ncbi:MAG: hypothetical protein GF346_08945 [Candidatus Eisenbacteria bacterium]|nr:hypothetical protein [Candidatus Latescibacterota bacterium]MBD3302560.1 hypothetical protein [Candidatus Eisenbacteria bacterium]
MPSRSQPRDPSRREPSWRSPRRRRFLRDLDAGTHLDLFLVCAVSTVLAIRFYLRATGYPQIGGGDLHIAHMLWGGLLMLAALILLMSYLDRGVRPTAAVLGGIGFGTFIDEIGKFVTHDNDYFYEPTPSLIYAAFVLVYLAIRSIHRDEVATREEYLVNALKEVEEIAIGDLSREERERAVRYLKRSDPGNPLVSSLLDLMNRTDLVPAGGKSLPLRLRDAFFDRYRKLTRLPWFGALVVGFFFVQFLVTLAHTIAITLFDVGLDDVLRLPLLGTAGVAHAGGSISDWGQLLSSLLAGAFIGVGIYRFRGSRLEGLQLFQKSVMVSIFLTQVFLFASRAWTALAGVLFDLLLFLALRFMIERERSLQETANPR